MAWGTASTAMLNTYRVAHSLTTPAAFASPYNQALLTNPGIGRQSPTMARRKDKRRVPKEVLALAVRKNFNSAAVSETDVVVELVYKVRHQGKNIVVSSDDILASLSRLRVMLMLTCRPSIPDAISSFGREEALNAYKLDSSPVDLRCSQQPCSGLFGRGIRLHFVGQQ